MTNYNYDEQIKCILSDIQELKYQIMFLNKEIEKRYDMLNYLLDNHPDVYKTNIKIKI